MSRKSLIAIILAVVVLLAAGIVALIAGNGGEPQKEPPAPSPQPGPADEDNYEVTVTPSMVATDVGATVSFTATVTNNGVPVELGSGANLWWWLDHYDSHSDGNSDAVYSADDVGVSLGVDVTFPSAGTYYMAAELKVDDERVAIAYATVTTSLPVEPVEASIYVPYVSSDENFIRGTDVSSLLAILNGGARFYDWDGNSLGDTVEAQGAGFMKLLKDAGANWIRLRVWNDPFDAEGHGYGGGNNDLEAAKIMGKWATDAGLRVLIDFHYSDFWADPSKQMVPKAWEGYTVDEKADAIEKFTAESVSALLDAGVDVGMVQVGNETTNAICGESDWNNMAKLFSAGSAGVRSVSGDILVALHFTNPEWAGHLEGIAAQLDSSGVDYDVFASSYYPYWHGTVENLSAVLGRIASDYGKRVMVAETSWAWTLDDGDGNGNTVALGNNDADAKYPFSVQGQALAFADVAKAVKNVGALGLGVFYWENAWIPVGDVSGLTGAEYTAKVTENRSKWEEFGAGWASSYASDYDPDDAGRYYGGAVVENQAMFDFAGRPLESLKVFGYITRGTYGYKNEVVAFDLPLLEVGSGEELKLPEKIAVTYADGTGAELSVSWDAGSVAAVDLARPGLYTVRGTAEGSPVTLTVKVTLPNMLENPGFEDEDMSVYTLTGAGIARTGDDPYSGSSSLHFYSASEVEVSASQTVTLAPGTYVFSMYGQGGDMGSAPVSYIYVSGSGVDEKCDFSLDGWVNWKNPSITFTVEVEAEFEIGLYIKSAAGSWGTFDDWSLGILE